MARTRCPFCDSSQTYATSSRAIIQKQPDGSFKTLYMAYRCRQCGECYTDKTIEDNAKAREELEMTPLTDRVAAAVEKLRKMDSKK